jgi:hypothetical protein
MKRILTLLIAVTILLSVCGCSSSVEKTAMEQTLSTFTEALKRYDREAMGQVLTAFPDNSGYVYLDDIFNDDPYIELYQHLYADITYNVESLEKNRAVVTYHMPNVQNLFMSVSAMVMNLAMSDANLQEKLIENDENGIILIQEMMLSLAEQGNSIEEMSQKFTLTFTEQEGKTLIVCNDELRALITGNFFLSKSMTVDEIESGTVD